MDRTPDRWTEVTVDIPTAARDAVVAWYLDRGADGVQEDYAELRSPGEDRGPVVSGDPSEWAGDAPEASAGRILVTGWLPPPAEAEREAVSLRALLAQLSRTVAGCDPSLVTAHEIPSQDWNAEWKSHWSAMPVGNRLIVSPSWEVPHDPGDRTVVLLDPGMAFGTGTHFTTATCLEIAEDLLPGLPVPVRVLDVGTGSGVLAIAALLLGASEAVGIDVDPDAVDEAVQNAVRNGVGDRFQASTNRLVAPQGPYELVFANIVAQTLLKLADALAGSVAPGGALLTSGVLRCHEGDVDDAFVSRGLQVVARRRDDAWVTTAYRRP